MVGAIDFELLAEHAGLLTAIADPVRLNLLHQLAERGTRCVCDLQTDPPIPANLLSYHLKVLRVAGLVTAARRGRWVDYALTPDALERLHRALPSAGSTPGPDTGPTTRSVARSATPVDTPARAS
ncbi:MAG TPA: metalloregulator ArsR/SmtB family transcription factor [Dermatophilaceae bacterium]|nr:metalloregulator ArsR/SmtB family transcription factor [Dermatophilaceae bacterium]